MNINKKDEHKVIDIINSKINLPDLKYENIRNKVEIQIESNNKTAFFRRNFAIQFVCVLICVMVIGISFLGDINNSGIGFTGAENSPEASIENFIGNVIIKDDKIYIYDDSTNFLESVKPNLGNSSFGEDKDYSMGNVQDSISIVAILQKTTNKLTITKEKFLELIDTKYLVFVGGGSLEELGNNDITISFRYSDENVDGYMVLESNKNVYKATYKFNYLDIISKYSSICKELDLYVLSKEIKLSYNEAGFVFTFVNIEDREVTFYECDLS